MTRVSTDGFGAETFKVETCEGTRYYRCAPRGPRSLPADRACCRRVGDDVHAAIDHCSVD